MADAVDKLLDSVFSGKKDVVMVAQFRKLYKDLAVKLDVLQRNQRHEAKSKDHGADVLELVNSRFSGKIDEVVRESNVQLGRLAAVIDEQNEKINELDQLTRNQASNETSPILADGDGLQERADRLLRQLKNCEDSLLNQEMINKEIRKQLADQKEKIGELVLINKKRDIEITKCLNYGKLVDELSEESKLRKALQEKQQTRLDEVEVKVKKIDRILDENKEVFDEAKRLLELRKSKNQNQSSPYDHEWSDDFVSPASDNDDYQTPLASAPVSPQTNNGRNDEAQNSVNSVTENQLAAWGEVEGNAHDVPKTIPVVQQQQRTAPPEEIALFSFNSEASADATVNMIGIGERARVVGFPKYSFATQETFGTWVQRLKDEIDLVEPNADGNRKRNLLRLHLDGMARETLEKLPEWHIKPFDDLVQILKDRFDQSNCGALAQLKRFPSFKVGESMRAYGEKLQILVKNAYIQHVDEVVKMKLLEAFLARLPKEMARYVVEKEPKNFQEANHYAGKWLNIDFNIGNLDQSEASTGQEIAWNRIENTMVDLHRRLDRIEQSNLPPSPDWSSRFSPEPSWGPRTAASPQLTRSESWPISDTLQWQQTPRREVTCFHCGHQGHIRTNCPELRMRRSSEEPQAVRSVHCRNSKNQDYIRRLEAENEALRAQNWDLIEGPSSHGQVNTVVSSREMKENSTDAAPRVHQIGNGKYCLTKVNQMPVRALICTGEKTGKEIKQIDVETRQKSSQRIKSLKPKLLKIQRNIEDFFLERQQRAQSQSSVWRLPADDLRSTAITPRPVHRPRP